MDGRFVTIMFAPSARIPGGMVTTCKWIPCAPSDSADITDKDIKQAAQRISAELVKRINAAVKSEDEQLNKYAKP